MIGVKVKYDSTMLNIGRVKQLLIDDLIIESVENICRTWHKPVRTEESPLIIKDKPWEHIVYFSCNVATVLYDEKSSLFKCWYTDWEKPEVKAGEYAVGNTTYNLLYAESENGIIWHKPILNLFEVAGNESNCVIPDLYVPGIVLDSHEKDENKRFKLMGNVFNKNNSTEYGKIAAFGSIDGIHWNRLSSKQPIIGRFGSNLDDVVIMSYENDSRNFIMNTRHIDMYAVARNPNNTVLDMWCPPYYPLDWRRMNKRRIYQAESSDFIHWSEPYSILTPIDGEDNLDETFYGLRQFRIGCVRLGFLNIFNYVSNTMSVQLVYSRDGKKWYHLNKRQPFLAPQGKGYWDEFMVTITSQPIEVGNELYIYFGGSSNHHDWFITGKREGLTVPEAHDITKVNYGLGLVKLRIDGFCSLDAGPARPGIFITRPLISDGKQLVANIRCKPNGSITAEVVNMRDEILTTYAPEELRACVPGRIKWRGYDIATFTLARDAFGFLLVRN